MARSYTPGLKILSHTKLVKRRLLPMKGSVHYNIGDIKLSEEPEDTQTINESLALRQLYTNKYYDFKTKLIECYICDEIK